MRKETVRVEDVRDAERLVIRAIYGRVTPAEKFQAALALQAIPPERLAKLAELVPEFKTNNLECVHPSVIRKQRSNCAPFSPQPIRRNVRNLWIPNGHLKPKIILY